MSAYQHNIRTYVFFKAMVLSIVGLSASLGFACLSPIVGLTLDHRGAIFTYWAMSIATLTGVAILFVFRRIQRAREPVPIT